MASKINTQLKRMIKDKTIYEVVRPQAKSSSRYKIKKQSQLAQQILDDLEQLN